MTHNSDHTRQTTERRTGVRRRAAATGTFLGLASLVGGCQGTQLGVTTIDVASTIDSIQSKQVIDNFGRIIPQNYVLPSQVLLNGGVVQIVNTVTPSVTFPLTSLFTRTISAAPSTVTTLAGAGASIGASVSWQENFTIQPVTDPFTLRNLNVLYRTVIANGKDKLDFLIHNYQVPRSYDRSDNLVPDPYYMENATCVLCLDQDFITAIEAGKGRLPKTNDEVIAGVKGNNIKINDALNYQWLFWKSEADAQGGLKPFNVAPENLRRIGSNNGYDFFVSTNAYAPDGTVANDRPGDKLFSDFILLTLPLANVPQRFSSLATPKAPQGGTEKAAGPTVSAAPGAAAPAGVNNGAEGSRMMQNLMIPFILPNPQ